MPEKPKSYRQKERHYKSEDKNRPSPSKRGYDRNWQRLRIMQLHREPLCRMCKKEGRLTPATEVDHIVPLRVGGANAFSNLQSLCKSCHSKKTAMELGAHKRKGIPVQIFEPCKSYTEPRTSTNFLPNFSDFRKGDNDG